MNAVLHCPDGPVTAVRWRVPGAEIESTFVWMEGIDRIDRALESWDALVRDRGFVLETRIVGLDANECGEGGGVVLATLYNDKGSRVQGIAVDPAEWPEDRAIIRPGVAGALDKARSVWARAGNWKWLALAAALAGLAYAAWKGKYLK